MQLFYGLVIHSTSLENLHFLPNTAVLVQEDGKIALVQPDASVTSIKQQFGVPDENVIILKDTEFLMPGMIDTHIHAPQYVNAGMALDLPLLSWLTKYTFPTESRFKDVDFARKVYKRVVARTLMNGTTTAMYFATLHKEASLALADVAHKLGQRAFVGKISMDQHSPDFYVEETSEALAEVEDFIVTLQSKKYPTVEPAITPRFSVNCSMGLMTKLAELAAKYDLNIQTHVAENPAECKLATSMYPECENYVDIYRRANLLTPKTVLAHGIYLSDKELAILNSHRSSISHCPNSNCSIRSGLCDVRRLVENGVHVGLGTDVSGGYNASMLDAMRFAMTVSNVLSFSKSESYKPLNFRHVFFLATLGGAQALGLQSKVGHFEAGKSFDALIVDLAASENGTPLLDLWPEETMEDRLSKWIHLGDDRTISKVYVEGVEVKKGTKEM